MDDMANMHPLPRNAFEWITGVPVHQATEIHDRINSTTNPFDDSSFLPPVDPLTDPHNNVDVRRMIPVPYRYVNVVLNTMHMPVALYRIIAQDAIAHRRAGLRPLVDWLRVAITLSPSAHLGGMVQPPMNHMGELRIAFPSVPLSPRYLRFVKGIIKEDFVHLREDPVSNQDRLMAALNSFNQATQVERQAAADARAAAADARTTAVAAATVPKPAPTPSESFPFTVSSVAWRCVTSMGPKMTISPACTAC